MDISKETDVTKLKALAYDQLALAEQTQQNLRMINGKIAELSESTETPKK